MMGLNFRFDYTCADWMLFWLVVLGVPTTGWDFKCSLCKCSLCKCNLGVRCLDRSLRCVDYAWCGVVVVYVRTEQNRQALGLLCAFIPF